MDPTRLGAAVRVLRWLAGELAGERHALAHVAAEVAGALLAEPAPGVCRACGGPLPPPGRTGRPRVLCVECSPRKTRGKVDTANMEFVLSVSNETTAARVLCELLDNWDLITRDDGRFEFREWPPAGSESE